MPTVCYSLSAQNAWAIPKMCTACVLKFADHTSILELIGKKKRATEAQDTVCEDHSLLLNVRKTEEIIGFIKG